MGRKQVVARVLHRFGKAGVIRREIAGVFNPTLSTVTGQTTLEFECKGTLQTFKSEDVDGTEVLRDDMKYLVPAADFEDPNTRLPLFEPQRGDRVTITSTNQEFIVLGSRLLDADKAHLIHVRGGGVQFLPEAS